MSFLFFLSFFFFCESQIIFSMLPYPSIIYLRTFPPVHYTYLLFLLSHFYLFLGYSKLHLAVGPHISIFSLISPPNSRNFLPFQGLHVLQMSQIQHVHNNSSSSLPLQQQSSTLHPINISSFSTYMFPLQQHVHSTIQKKLKALSEEMEFEKSLKYRQNFDRQR